MTRSCDRGGLCLRAVQPVAVLLTAGSETAGSRARRTARDVDLTLLLPETRGEYERARAEVERLVRDDGGGEVAGPTEDGKDGTDAMPVANHWVVTTGAQRLAWGLSDLGGVASVPVRTRDDLHHAWSRGAVPLVDAEDAVRLLAGSVAKRRDDDGVGGGEGPRAFGPPRPEHTAAELVNLKHDRGPIPVQVRDTFDELSGRSRIDALLDMLDEVLGPLERETLPRLRRPAASSGRCARCCNASWRRNGRTRLRTPDRRPMACFTSREGCIRCCGAYAASPPRLSSSTRPCCRT